MEQRVSLITLGVDDLDRAVGFYSALGWKPANDPQEQGVAFFQCGGMVVELWKRDELAGDCRIDDPGGWGGVTVAQNVESPEAVDATLMEAERAGATIGRSGATTPWGSYSGYFVDPDGHPWEVAHNPSWTFDEDGSIKI